MSKYVAVALLMSCFSPLAQYRWTKRIILISGANNDVSAQMVLLDLSKEDYLDRDLVVFRLDHKNLKDINALDHDLPSSDIAEYYNIDLDKFNCVLIGKDGGIKGRWEKSVNPSVIYARIDQMPMRRMEMKNSPH